MEKYKGKYRIPSTRWSSWDYGVNASYFITICTAQRTFDFGTITDGEMVLTPLGQRAWDYWQEIPDHFPFVVLDEFVVMPNHVHGIVIIDKPDNHNPDPTGVVDSVVETQNLASLRSSSRPPPKQPLSPKNKFGPQSKNLASIVRGYKIGVTKYARKNGIPFVWQPRYHDHVIRNPEEHMRIRQYIYENPKKWMADIYYAS